MVKIWVKTHFFLGESLSVFPKILDLKFIENQGMAMGLKYGGNFGKVNLTVSRLFFAIFLLGILQYFLRIKVKLRLLFPFVFLFVGLTGNLLDNIFYASFFELDYGKGVYIWGQLFRPEELFFGKVVDMFFLPLFPFFIFNLADVYISLGFILFWFNRHLFFIELFKLTDQLSREDQPSQK